MNYNVRLISLSLFISLTSCFNDDFDNNSNFSNPQWAKVFGGMHDDHAYAVIQTRDGNLAVFGYTNSIDGDITDKTLQENDYWLMKLTTNGEFIWSKTYGGSGDDKGQEVIETTDGGFAIVGYSMSADGNGSNNEGFHDNWILKLDSFGEIQWEKSYGFSGHDHAYSVLQTNDGGFFMTGFLDVTASGGEGNLRRRHGVGEFWCHRLNANGDVIWRRYFGGTQNDRSFDAVQANDGGFVITGFTESNDFDITDSRGSYDYWVIKLDTNGNLVWETSVGGSGIDQARSIVKTNNNSYLVVGNSFSTDGDITQNLGNSDFFIANISDNGEVVWTKNYGGSDFDFATSITPTNQGYLVTGYSKSTDNHLSSNSGDNDFWVLKIDSNGNILDEKSFGGAGLDLAHDIIQLNDGSIVVVGETESNDFEGIEHNGMKDALIIKFNQ
jgi:hypothetical protein